MDVSRAFLSASAEILLKKVVKLISQEILGARGLKEELTRLKGSLLMIQAVLNDAELQQVNETSLKLWLNNLKPVASEADCVLGEFTYEMERRKVEIRNQIKKKVISFFKRTNPIVFDIKMAHKIKDINTSLEKINKEALAFGLQRKFVRGGNPHQITQDHDVDSFLDDSLVIGRENDASKLVEMLIGTTSDEENISFIPIVGTGGIGKTALAKLVYNDERVMNHFDARVWVRVSGRFDVKSVLIEILESLKGNKCEAKSKDLILSYLEKELRGKKYMLLLDDACDEDAVKWEEFSSCLFGVSTRKGNKIFITTGGVRVASVIHTRQVYHLEGLAEDDCWSLIKGRAFVSGGAPMSLELGTIGREIARKCRGVPLAAKVVGSMMRYKTKNDDWLSVQNGGFWGLVGEGENGLLPALKMSIDHLPSLALKQCFAYCSIFPKDWEIEKEQVIQLWMAVGFLQSDEGSDKVMEAVGNEFFNALLRRSLFQDVEKDKYKNVTSFKLHGLVHDLAREIPHVQQEALCFSRELVFAVQNEKARFLRTLFLKSKLPDNMLHFKCLRVLNSSGANIEEVSDSIGELIHMRYLDLSNTAIKVLPKSVGKLYNLQTLRVDWCKNLKVLPNELKNLINLRHLYFRGHNCEERQLPHKIQRLTNLQTLHFFNVGKDVGRQIKELGYLKHLRGEVEIHNLEQVSCREEAQSANLFGKENIYKLEFHWNLGRSGNKGDEGVLEGLEPHPNLKSLTIQNFLGVKFPTWVMNMSVSIDGGNGGSSPLSKLVEIKLINCRRFEHIPMLGQLPLLLELEVSGTDNMTIIGSEFYGHHYSCNSSESTSNTNRGGIETTAFFPALRKFRLENMPNLKEWMEAVFPCLEKLTIRNCPELTTCPSHFPFLKELEIRGVNSGLPLAKICSNLTTLTTLHILGVSALTSLPNRILQENKYLARLEIRNCPMLTRVVPSMWGCFGSSLRSLGIGDCESLRYLPDGIHTLPSLENFWISRCPNIKSITSMQGLKSLRRLCLFSCDGLVTLSSGLMESCTSLETLHLHDCANLISFPKLQELPCSLLSLRIVNCDKLTLLLDGLQRLTRLNTLAIGTFSEELNSFPSLDGIQHLKLTLRHVELKGRPHWDSIPEQLQNLIALKEIHLKGFGVEVLPEWFAKFSSLDQLVLEDCEKLKHFPTMEAMQCITKLRELWIQRCPILDERCAKGTGPEWPKIAYIPTIRIDMTQVQSQASP